MPVNAERGQERQALPVASDEKGAMSPARRRKQ